MKALNFATLTAAALLVLGASAPAVAVPPVAGRARYVVVLGDSLSDPKAHGGGYLQPLSARCQPLTLDNRSKGGFMVNQMRRRFEREVLPRLPSQATDLVVFGGVNDLYSDETALRSLPKIQADLSAIYRAGRARGLRVIAIEVTPWGGFSRYYTQRRGENTRRLNAWLHEQRAAGAVDVVVPANALLACGDPERLCADYEPPFHDGLHFGKRGHERLSSALLELAFPHCSK